MVPCQHASKEIRGRRRYDLLKASQTQLIQIHKHCLIITLDMQRLTVAWGGGASRFLKCIQPDQESEQAASASQEAEADVEAPVEDGPSSCRHCFDCQDPTKGL